MILYRYGSISELCLNKLYVERLLELLIFEYMVPYISQA